ncbi:MAG: hypothetical protein H7Y86_18180 [Rhizobacter sp.]|nr:hypothetical protein [Ferruginibacter sp.]
MNSPLKFWHKILLTIFCFGIAVYCFIIKLPAAFRGHDKELHAAFYFLAAAFLNILFTKKNIFIHALLFGGLYVFGMLIEYAQVYSKKRWHIPHGRYDPEDVQNNLKGLILFSILWLLFTGIGFLLNKNSKTQPPAANEKTPAARDIY